jgi:glutamate--cysteine ligase
MNFTEEIYKYIRNGESQSKNLGLEIEHFVVNEEGRQIGFELISPLIKKVGDSINARIIYMDGYPVGYHNGRYSVTLEPACQFEISVDPYSDIDSIGDAYNDFLSLWTPVLEELSYRFISKGNLPLVEKGIIKPDQITLSPKKRYKYMDAYFEKSGRYGKYMMRASASTQVSVDYCSEADLVKKLRVLQKISPILMIMTENKTDEASSPLGDKPHLLRIQEWEDLDKARTGFYPHSFDEDFGYRKIAEVIYNTPLILLTDKGETTDVGSKSAADLFDEGAIKGELGPERIKSLTEHFMSMGFFHFRIKTYIEIRIADSLPTDKALAYVALIKGLIYSEENLTALDERFSFVDSIEKIQEAVCSIEKEGRKALIYDGRTANEWAEYLKKMAEKGLPESEKRYLNNV